MIKAKGSILIFTLWVLIILIMLTVALSRRASSDIALAKYEHYNVKALYLAKAGIVKMLTELTKDTNGYDSLNEDWNRNKDNHKELKIGDETVFYGSSDEDGRLNLNSPTLKKEQLVELGIVDAISHEIIDYKTRKGDKGFEFMEELFLIEGMTAEIYSSIKDLVTIYRGIESKVNINTASEKALLAVIGDNSLVQEILVYRKGSDDKEGTEDDVIFKNPSDLSMIEGLDSSLFTVTSNVFRIWAQSFFSEDKKISREIEAVINRSGKIYLWKEY